WNQVRQHGPHPLWAGIEDDAFFYFVHSYFCDVDDQAVVIGETCYGASYASVVAQGTVCGVQFHPEKSQAAGLRLLANFSELVARTEQFSATSQYES
ncbi:MAG: hypothetical protein ABR568_22180, partial [Pyrinomonadaceae bacterium]